MNLEDASKIKFTYSHWTTDLKLESFYKMEDRYKVHIPDSFHWTVVILISNFLHFICQALPSKGSTHCGKELERTINGHLWGDKE